MDTRFWGPCGWVLLHSLTSNYPDKPKFNTKNSYKIFFSTLPNILPCIYCRRSLSQYYFELPLTDEVLENRNNLMEWLYHIHNKVNDKLRDQGLIDYPNPKLKTIINKYKKTNNYCNIKKCWNFLYSIGMNYPEKKEEVDIEKKYNYYHFFNFLTKLFPDDNTCEKMINYYQSYNLSMFLENRYKLLKWLYGMEKIIDCNCNCYKNRIEKTSQYIAGCKGISGEKPTCRIEKYIKE